MSQVVYNTRIAPSPTGNFHLGTARTAYMNYLAARSTGGKFILRIDDTDSSRSDDSFITDIVSTMKWLGLDYDVMFRQSSRFDHYIKVALNLVVKGIAVQKNGAIVLNVNGIIGNWNDSVSGKINVDTSNHYQLVLIKSDGTATYHFATVVDDIDFNINMIIRGVDHIPNTVKHLYIYNALGAIYPTYAHIGLIHQNGRKISKRDGAASMKFYQDNGYLPAAVLNILVKMGWGHPDPNFDKKYKFISKDVAVDLFQDGNLRATPSTLDMNKLDYYNRYYKAKKET